MLIGAMNHPKADVLAEIAWMAEMGLDFIDLTLEPPVPAAWRVEPAAIAAALEQHGMAVVGHTAYYLPLASPFESLRRAAVAEMVRCMDVFAAIGARWMNVHPDRPAPMHDRKFCIQQNLQSLRELLEESRRTGVGLMIENLPGNFNNVSQLSDLLDPLPELGVHLDIGHANLQVSANTAGEIIRAYGPRLRHVHLHDNRGGWDDLHLPLGAGNLAYARHVRNLKSIGYDGTITLEVFTPDRRYVALSREILRKVWDG